MPSTVYQSVKRGTLGKAAIARCVDQTLRSLKKKKYHVTIHLIGSARMKTLNRLARDKEGTTDVLSFPTESSIPGANEHDAGDIFLCVPHVTAQAREYGVPVREESMRMIIHGVLHLFGYDHQTEKEAARMFTLQERLLTTCL